MAPILIDRRSLIKLSLVLAICMFALFFSGYFIGFYKAEAFINAGIQTRSLDLPDASMVALDETAYIPTVIEPGLDRDVDAPDTSHASPADATKDTKLVTTATHSETGAGATGETSAVKLLDAPAVDDVQTQTVAVGGPLGRAAQSAAPSPHRLRINAARPVL